ncbi:WxcM-like domain-containing protein [Flavihumibacter sp. R14]|nr:WxcM-like domain-containing protein [Flavihumibacter soli]
MEIVNPLIRRSTLDNVKIIDFPKILDPRGNLSFLEENASVPFKIERTYWIYDVPGGEIRGSHAFKNNCELIVALSGSFDVCLNDGFSERKIPLNRSYYGLYVPEMLWRKLENFSTNSLALVLSSTVYDENDYIRDYDHFLTLKANKNGSNRSV